MTEQRDDGIYIEYMIECIRRIECNAAGGKATFLTSHTLQDAVLRNLQTLAESSQRLSDVAKATQPQIPWREVAAFRNVLVHNYLGIDLDMVWTIIQRDIPTLRDALLALQNNQAAEKDDGSA